MAPAWLPVEVNQCISCGEGQDCGVNERDGSDPLCKGLGDGWMTVGQLP